MEELALKILAWAATTFDWKFWLVTLAVFTQAIVTWIYYIGAMRLVALRKSLHPIAKIVGYYGIAIGLVLDVVWNLTASVLLLDFPREFLFTSKLQRLKADGGWRSVVAYWVCEHMLNQFDPDGKHC